MSFCRMLVALVPKLSEADQLNEVDPSVRFMFKLPRTTVTIFSGPLLDVRTNPEHIRTLPEFRRQWTIRRGIEQGVRRLQRPRPDPARNSPLRYI